MGSKRTIGIVTFITLLASGGWAASRHVLINLTPSCPLGIYRVHRRPIQHGELVAIRLDPDHRQWIKEREYALVWGRFFLLKPVLTRGEVRVTEVDIKVDGVFKTFVRSGKDREGRPLPVQTGIFECGPEGYFALEPTLNSLDSRYIGPIMATQVVGVAVPLWVWEGS